MWDQDQKRAKDLWVHQKVGRVLPSYERVCWCLLQTLVPQGKSTNTHSSLCSWGCRPTPKTQGSGLFFIKLLSEQIFYDPYAPRLFTCGECLQIRTNLTLRSSQSRDIPAAGMCCVLGATSLSGDYVYNLGAHKHSSPTMVR